MALLFMDGFDHYATADIAKKWSSVTATIAVASDANNRRSGSSYMSLGATSNRYCLKTLPSNIATIVFGMAVRYLGTGNKCVLAMIREGTSTQCAIGISATGILQVWQYTDGTVLVNSSYTMPTNQWHYIEAKITISNSSGMAVVKVDGVTVINGSSLNTRNGTSNNYTNSFGLGSDNGSVNSFNGYVDDLYVCDTSGSANNDFLGDCRIDTVFPAADGHYNQFSPTGGGTHYSQVNSAAPNLTNYVADSTSGDRDGYTLTALPSLTTPTVFAVQMNAAALKSDAGTRTLKNFVRESSTDHDDSSAFGLGTSQNYDRTIWEQDPAIAAAWTQSAVNAAEFGVTVAS